MPVAIRSRAKPTRPHVPTRPLFKEEGGWKQPCFQPWLEIPTFCSSGDGWKTRRFQREEYQAALDAVNAAIEKAAGAANED